MMKELDSNGVINALDTAMCAADCKTVFVLAFDMDYCCATRKLRWQSVNLKVNTLRKRGKDLVDAIYLWRCDKGSKR